MKAIPWFVAACLLPLLPAPSGVAPDLPAAAPPGRASGLGGGGPDALVCEDPLPNKPCNIRVTSGNPAGEGNEPSLAINPFNPLNLLVGAKDYSLTDNVAAGDWCPNRHVWAGYYVTTNGGQTWTNGHIPGYPGNDAGPLGAYNCFTDPVVAFDNAGNAYYVGTAWNDMGTAPTPVWVARSATGGTAWDPDDIHIIPTGENAADPANEYNDKPWIAVDPDTGTVHVAWLRTNENNNWLGQWYSRSENDALTDWLAPVRICDPCGLDLGATPLLSPDGNVYVTWTDDPSNCYQPCENNDVGNLLAARWDGAAFTDRTTLHTALLPSTVREAYRIYTIPDAAVNRCLCPHAGDLYVVWHELTADGDVDVFFSRSSDGMSWTEPRQLSAEVPQGQPVNDEYYPAIAVDPADGVLHVVWYDERDDPNRKLINVYYTRSSTNGVAWSAPVRISTRSTDPQYSHHQKGDVFMGDYIGIDALDGLAWPVWTDTRDQREDIYTARITTSWATITGWLTWTPDVPGNDEGGLVLVADDPLRTATVRLTVPRGLAVVYAEGGAIEPQLDGSTLVVWRLGAMAEGDRELRYGLTNVLAGEHRLVATLEFETERGNRDRREWTRAFTVEDAVPGRGGAVGPAGGATPPTGPDSAALEIPRAADA